MLSSPFPIEYLSELIEKFEAGVNYPPISENELASEWRVLKISAVTWGEFNPKESKPIKPNTVFADSLIVRKGDLIISRANTTELVGAVALVRNTPPKVLLSDKLWRIKFSENSRLLPEYALLALRQPEVRRIIEELATGSSGSMQNISMEKAAIIPIPLPPIAEQKRIAAIAQKCDRLRRTRRYTQQLSNSYLRSVFLEMFGDPVKNPMNWKSITLEDVLVSAKDGPHVSPSYTGRGVPFLSTRNIRPGEVIWDDLKFVSREDAEDFWKRGKPERGDILYTKGGTTGLAKAIDFDREVAVWVHIAVLKVKQNLVAPLWLENMLNSNYCYQQSQELTFGIVNRDLGLQRMPRIKMYLPPLPLQEKFSQIVQRFERLRTQQREADRQAEHLFQTILHRAFRGEL